jgi:phosphoglycerol transferase MdoB-like AlkP superfamily enzyme
MKNYFTGNGFNVIDRSDIDKQDVSFSNVWGVADEDLFKKFIEVADRHNKLDRNFFSLIMTTSNHRPYNFPEGRIDLPQGTRNAAVKYTDYAIGKFIEVAKTKPWFDDTIFVIIADHCASSAGKVDLPLEKYKIPLIIYAPSFIKPSTNDNLASQIDVPPTILAMTSLNYRSKFFGQDIISSPPNRAFISTYQLLGYVSDSNLIILSPNVSPVGYDVGGVERKLIDPPKDLVEESISYHQLASKLIEFKKMQE